MILSVENLVKRYSSDSPAVLNNISLFFETGNVYGILGENGAGKSTLAHILSGSLMPSGGTVKIDGVPVAFNSPKDSLNRGISIVRQKRALSLEASFWENIELAFRTTDKKSVKYKLRNLEECFDFYIEKNMPVKYFNEGEQFFLSLYCALLHEPNFLILDEPSASLTDVQSGKLETGLRKLLKKANLAVIVITHSLNQASSFPDILYILRKFTSPILLTKKCSVNELLEILCHDSSINHPESVKSDACDFNADKILRTPVISWNNVSGECGLKKLPLDKRKLKFPVKLLRCFNFNMKRMSGKKSCSAKEKFPGTVPVLEIRNLTSRYLKDISFSVLKNEIILISGMEEDGIKDLQNVLLGLEHGKSGAVYFNGEFLKQGRPDLLQKNNVALISPEPFIWGSDEKLSVRELVSAKILYNSGFFYYPATVDSAVKAAIDREDFPCTPDLSQSVSELSGGMIQRLILERELSGNINLAILCEPDKGIDRMSLKRLFNILENDVCNRAPVLILTKNPQLYKKRKYKKACLFFGKLRWCNEVLQE